MSLEQAIADNTAAIRDLIAAMKPAAEKPVKPKKVEADATKYYFSEKNNTVYEVRPGEPDVVLGDAVVVTKAEFDAHKVRLAAKFAHLSEPKVAEQTAISATTETVTEVVVEVTQETLMKQVVLLSQRADGRAQMEKILATFGVPKFSLLPGQRRAEALAAVEKALAA